MLAAEIGAVSCAELLLVVPSLEVKYDTNVEFFIHGFLFVVNTFRMHTVLG